MPGISVEKLTLSIEISRFMQRLRTMKLSRVPGVAETLDWAQALAVLHASHLDESLVRETLGCFLKDESDLRLFGAALDAGSLEGMVGAA